MPDADLSPDPAAAGDAAYVPPRTVTHRRGGQLNIPHYLALGSNGLAAAIIVCIMLILEILPFAIRGPLVTILVFGPFVAAMVGLFTGLFAYVGHRRHRVLSLGCVFAAVVIMPGYWFYLALKGLFLLPHL